MLTKKDFVALADELKRLPVGYMHPCVVDALCDFMRHSNPRFNPSRWRSYLKGECGPSGRRIA